MIKYLLFLLLLTPGIYLGVSVFWANDPIKYIYTYSGYSSLVILLLSLLISPLKKVYNLLRYRKMFGLFAFFYALVHFLNFILLDAQVDISFIIKETIEKPFIYLGTIAFLILLFMAFTSTKKLFAKFHRWHKLVYISLILVVIHQSMAQKVLGFWEYLFILVTALLLLFRRTYFVKLLTKGK